MAAWYSIKLGTERYDVCPVQEWGDRRYVIIGDIRLQAGIQLLRVVDVTGEQLVRAGNQQSPHAMVWAGDGAEEGRYTLVRVVWPSGEHDAQFVEQALPVEVIPGNRQEAREQLMREERQFLEAQTLDYRLRTEGVDAVVAEAEKEEQP